MKIDQQIAQIVLVVKLDKIAVGVERLLNFRPDRIAVRLVEFLRRQQPLNVSQALGVTDVQGLGVVKCGHKLAGFIAPLKDNSQHLKRAILRMAALAGMSNRAQRKIQLGKNDFFINGVAAAGLVNFTALKLGSGFHFFCVAVTLDQGRGNLGQFVQAIGF